MSKFEAVLTALPARLRDGVGAHWEAFVAATKEVDLGALDGPWLEQLVRVWVGSELVARACIREPTLFLELLQSGHLSSSSTLEQLNARLRDTLKEVRDEDGLSRELRRFRRREMVRVVWRELAGLAPLEETLADMSNLAETVVDQALAKLFAWQRERFGTPLDEAGEVQELIVLGMGKLGGYELNLSSDIDLIFVYPRQGETDGRRSQSNEEFFRRLSQRLIKVLNEHTGEGIVFRVDMRLRPFGESGPLVLPFGAFEDYYQRHGRDWERYAMIKARVIAGDRREGEKLLERLRPFVYRRYLDYGAFESLRSMKALIAREVERKGLRDNIKLGSGGIREIEFIGQAFQLIYGGRDPALRQRGIMPVLGYLAASGRLPDSAVIGLKSAYSFLRRTENCLQAWADSQTHDIPADDLARLRLACAMEFSDWQAFEHELKRHRAIVAEQFEQIFTASKDAEEMPPSTLDFLSIWNNLTADDATVAFFDTQGFDNSVEALASLQRLKGSFSYRALSQQGRERIDQLIPSLLDRVRQTSTPAAILDRLIRLLEAVGRRSVYLTLLVERPAVLGRLIDLCAQSIWIAEHLTRYPLLLDDLLDPRTLYSPLDRDGLRTELERELARVPDDDAEQVLETLRYFKQSNVLRVAAADVTGALPLMRVSDHLTEIAEVLLRKVLELAWKDLEPRFGYPRCRTDGVDRRADLAIVAYGKLGGIELGYGSDLDLVFLHDSSGDRQHTTGPREIDNMTFFTRLTQRVIHMLTARIGAGVLYEVDTRLRPSGGSGLLVSSVDAFATYQRENAWTWEHQALVRARSIAGASALTARFEQIRREILRQPRDPGTLRREVREMRERMRDAIDPAEQGRFHIKQGRGGIADIEFMVQYNVLANAQRYPELLYYTDNIRQLDGLEQTGILTSADADLLRDAYRTLRRRSHLLKLQEKSSLISNSELSDYRQGVIRLWQTLMEG